MATAVLLAWFADQVRGRRAAVVAGSIFFLLGMLSPFVLAIVFLAPVVLCVIGFVDFSPESATTSLSRAAGS